MSLFLSPFGLFRRPPLDLPMLFARPLLTITAGVERDLNAGSCQSSGVIRA